MRLQWPRSFDAVVFAIWDVGDGTCQETGKREVEQADTQQCQEQKGLTDNDKACDNGHHVKTRTQL